MKIIKPSIEYLGIVPTDYVGALKFIEAAGRTCCKSEDKITPDSAEVFVKRLIKASHMAMVEHSNFVVRAFQEISVSAQEFDVLDVGKFLNKYEDGIFYYVGGNITAWYNHFKLMEREQLFSPFRRSFAELFFQDIPFVILDQEYDHWTPCPHDEIPKELHYYSVRFICDRGVSHELVRHRPCSFAQESTRYVNYGGKNMEFIEPAEFKEWPISCRKHFTESCYNCEDRYRWMLQEGLKPQQARAILPNALKTEIIVTADAAEWQHIHNLRTDKVAHPDMQRVMNMVPWDKILS